MKSSVLQNILTASVLRLWEISLNSRQQNQNWRPTVPYLYPFLVQHPKGTTRTVPPSHTHKWLVTNSLASYILSEWQRSPTDCFKYILQLCKRCSFTSFGKGMSSHNDDLRRAAFTAHLVWSSINLAIIWIFLYPTKVVHSSSIWITGKSAVAQEGRQVQAAVRMRSCLGCKGQCFTGLTV